MTALVIRPLEGLAEREACVALQERVWGPDFEDRVPASILMIAQETGGVASGAFLDGRLVGFVFGITGLRDGRPTHWSDMLAVDPAHRGRRIGYRLKLHQRQQLLDAGVETVRWTFEPLEAANAHINLRLLGATSGEYRRDVYGASDSPLHRGIGTDRLVVEWAIASERVVDRLAGARSPEAEGDPDTPIVNLARDGGELRPRIVTVEPVDPVVRVAIPSDIQALKRRDPEAAVVWRGSVRTALEVAFRAGYTAVDVERGEGAPCYVLERGFDR